MDPALIEAIFDGTARCGVRIRGVHLAGGEAFLNFPLLLQAVEIAARKRVPVDYVETNGHWFTTRPDAIAKLTALKEAGLRCIMVSASPQHAEYIPVETTLGAIEACYSVFGAEGMFVWLPEFLRGLEALGCAGKVPWDDYVTTYGPERARAAATYGGQLVTGGRAGFGQAKDLSLRPAEHWWGGNCRHELLESTQGHYDLYGNLLPGACSGLTLGDAHDLGAMCGTFTLDNRPVLRALAQGGVRELTAMAETDWGFMASPAGYADRCHLCMDIRRHLVASGCPAAEIAPRQLYAEI